MKCDELWWIVMNCDESRKDQKRSGKQLKRCNANRRIQQTLFHGRDLQGSAAVLGFESRTHSARRLLDNIRIPKALMMWFSVSEMGLFDVVWTWCTPTSTGLGNLENCGIAMVCHGIPVAVLFIGQTFPPLVALRKVSPCFLSASPSASLPEPLGGRVPFQYSRKRRDYAEVPTVVTSRRIDPSWPHRTWLFNTFQYFWMPFKSFHVIFIPSTIFRAESNLGRLHGDKLVELWFNPTGFQTLFFFYLKIWVKRQWMILFLSLSEKQEKHHGGIPICPALSLNVSMKWDMGRRNEASSPVACGLESLEQIDTPKKSGFGRTVEPVSAFQFAFDAFAKWPTSFFLQPQIFQRPYRQSIPPTAAQPLPFWTYSCDRNLNLSCRDVENDSISMGWSPLSQEGLDLPGRLKSLRSFFFLSKAWGFSGHLLGISWAMSGFS